MGYRLIDSDGTARDFVWMTYSEIASQRDAVGSALHHLELLPLSDDDTPLRMMGVFSKNRWEWIVSALAAEAYGGVTVPFYDTLGPDAVRFILNQTQLKTVFAGEAEAASLIAVKTEHADSLTAFTHVIQFEDVTPERRAAGEAAGLTFMSLQELCAVGRENPRDHMIPELDDITTFCYTSGTTGDPKGVMLTHKNVVACCSSAAYAGIDTTPDDVHLSYLPLAHMFERLVVCLMFTNGARIGFFQGDVKKLIDDIKALRPTIFPSVPRLFCRIYDRVVGGAAAAGGIKASMFEKGLDAKKYWLRRNHLHHGFWDGLVFNKLKARLGFDRVRLMATGSAPIAPHVMEFLRAAFGAAVIEGYGQTECAGVACVTQAAHQHTLGHVGGPMVCNEVRLESVSEMEYNVTDTVHGRVEKDGVVLNPGLPCEGRGEICYRGHNICAGYYKNPEKTAEAITEDGWLHSGDIGLWDSEGNIRVIDRKKNIFKLSQGEYVAAEKIENVYTQSPLVAQAFVYGDSLQSCLVGIFVPDEEYVMGEWAKNAGKTGATFAELCADPALKAAIAEDLKRVGKAGKLRGFECVKAIELESELWTVENDLLTPTFKLKRKQAKDKYQDQIDAMYASGIGVVAGQTGLKQDATVAAAAPSA
jgi:long-chain acyl-CoA synthetase